jgi:signal transduction histidine kinase
MPEQPSRDRLIEELARARQRIAELERAAARPDAQPATEAVPDAPLNPQLLLEMDEGLRASLHGLIGMVELALDTRLTAQQQEYLQLGRASADALLSAINNLLSVAKIDAGVFDLDPIPFSLRDSLGYTIGALALRARERNLKLVSHILENVPDALVGDPVVLRQAMGNLIEDAARRPGGGVVIVRVEKAWDTAQAVQLECSVTRHDTGPSPSRGPPCATSCSAWVSEASPIRFRESTLEPSRARS